LYFGGACHQGLLLVFFNHAEPLVGLFFYAEKGVYMNELIKYLVSAALFLIWMGVLFGFLVYAALEEDKPKQTNLFIGAGSVTISSTVLIGYLLSKRK
jgi:hypothetical protein